MNPITVNIAGVLEAVAAPDAAATAVPSADPSNQPTAQPEPTTDPTSTTAPTATPRPTQQPGDDTVTAVPTEQPSAEPSTGPSSTGTIEPSPTPTSTETAPAPPAWITRPAVADSGIPWGMVLIAGLVLVTAAAGLVWLWRTGALGGRKASTPADGATAGSGSATTSDGSGTAGPSTHPLPDSDTVTRELPTVDAPSAGDSPDDPTRELPTVESQSAGAAPVSAESGAPATGVIAVVSAGPDPDLLPAVVPTDTDPAAVPDTGPELTVSFLVRLGEAMVDSSSPIAQVNGTLERIAVVNDLPGTAVVTFPTALMVSVPDGRTVRTAVATAGSQTLRLDQVSDVLDLAQSAVRGDTRPAAGLRELDTILTSPPPSTGRRRALGYVAVAAGLSLVLGGGWLDVLIAAVLGGLVAVVSHLTRRMPAVYQALLTGACAFVVAVPVFLLVRTGLPVGLLAPLIGPLVTFLPGALLTTGVIDLATRQMIAGSARIASGLMQLVLLALGITAAAGLVGVPSTEVGTGGGQALGWAAPWIGVLIYAVGVVLNNDARTAALPWITLVLVVAYAGQVVGGALLGATVSSFVGALAMTPVAMVAATRPSGPPFLVTFLPGFWVLVPGALGLVGVTTALDGVTNQAITTIVTAGVSMVAISLGVLAGLALGSGLQRRLAPDVPPLI